MDLDRKYPYSVVFLDRDGVLSEERGHVVRERDLIVLPDVGKAIRMLNELNVLIIVVTNQSGIARGILSIERLKKIHSKLEKELMKSGGKLDGIYISPYLPSNDDNVDEGVSEYLINHFDRKPQIGMLKKAEYDFGLNLTNACLVGDSIKDLEAAKNAGIDFFGVRSSKVLEIEGKCKLHDSLYEWVCEMKTSK